MSSASTRTAHRGRLLRKYIVVFVGLVGGVLMASSLVELYFAYQETKGVIVREARATAVATAAKIEEFARDIERRVVETTRAASDDPAAAQLGLGKLGFRGGLGASLSEQRQLDFLRLLRDVPAISELSHLDVSGKEQLRVSRLTLDAVGSQEDFSQAPKFLETRSGKVYWSPVYFRSGAQPYVTFAVPVGQYAVEVTTAEISLKAVLQTIAQTRVGQGGYAYVVDSRGRLFAHPDMGLVREKRDLSALPQVRDARAERPVASGSPSGSTPSTASETNEAVTVAEGLRGGSILAAHAAIAPLGWLVVVERPLAEAYAPLRAPIVRSVVIFVLGLTLSVLASILLARRMVAPIRELQEGASRIGAGDLAHRVNVRTGDELEALGNELNRTAGQLAESYSNLEQKVEARTRELAEANAGLTEALEQQTATAEILRAISGSPTDIQPVLDTVVRAAARFCAASDVLLLRLDGTVLRGAAAVGPFRDIIVRETGNLAALEVPITRGSVSGRAFLDGETIHVEDLATVSEEDYPEGREFNRRFGNRTTAATPLLRTGTPIGVIVLFRLDANRFSPKQLDLLRLFADQAVIAIENVRLFTELEAKNSDLTEALERQTATSEVLKVISRSAFDLEPVLHVLAENATRLCAAEWCLVYRFDGEVLRVVAHHGAPTNLIDSFSAGGQAFELRPGPSSVTGKAAASRQTVHVHDVLADPDFMQLEAQKHGGSRAGLGVPMLRDGSLVGVFFLARNQPRPFSDGQIELVATFADQAVIAIENVRLFTELEAKNRDLTETLEQQTATAEILRVISSSPTDAQPVFDTIAANALRLCDGLWSVVTRFDGEFIHLVSHHNVGGPQRMEALHRAFPRSPRDGGVNDKAILTGTIAHVADARQDPSYKFGDLAQATGYQSILAVPMLQEGRVLGSICVTGAQARAFSPRQVELVRTFANQAVIAIENVRLFKELETKNRDLTETLEQQTATAEILRVISSSPTDAQPVFQTIAESAVRLCEAEVATVTRFDGELIHLGAMYGSSPEGIAALQQTFPMRPSAAGGAARAIRDRAVVHIPDILADPQYQIHETALTAGFRGLLGVPMLRDGVAIGAITLGRARAGSFTDTQVQLLRTFADQAVIAIENVRLFTELEAKNRDLTETLEQQTATAEILRVISSSPTDAQPVFDTIATNAAQLCRAELAWVFRFDGQILHFAAQYGLSPAGLAEVRRVSPIPLGRGSAAGRSILNRAIVYIPDVQVEPDYELGATADVMAFRSTVAVPMLRDGLPVGTIVVARERVGVFADRQVELLKTFADQAVIAIENVRLFTELEVKNRDLTETLEQQTATGEILRVISSSPTDTQPVFDTIAERALHLCGASVSGVLTYDGELVHIAALANVNPEGAAALRSAFPMRPSPASASTRSILTRAIVHIPDNLIEPGYEIAAQAGAGGFRSVLSLPMLREGKAIGCVTVGRPEPGRFSDRQIALLKTFADQAVIAIENVRLFTELEVKNRDLTETLEQQTATAEILRVISSSPTDVQPVFDTIVRNARALCGADSAGVFGYDGAMVRLESLDNANPKQAEALRNAYPMPASRGHATGRAILTGRPVHIPDVREDPEYALEALRDTAGLRTLLSVPMIRDGVPIGAISLQGWGAARAFSDRQIALLRTFADQAVIAIENVRLFRELETKNRDLTETLEQQTATSEVLKVISRSAFDLQPVLQTLIENAARLGGADMGAIYRFDGELQRLAAAYGMSSELRDHVEQHPLPPGRGTAVGRALLEGRPIHIADVVTDREYTYSAAALGEYRTILGVPMLREGVPIGVFAVTRREVLPFTDKQIELVTTFADQGAIAIENVRLFSELEVRTRDLTRSVGELQALGEVSQAVSSTLDLDAVLATIVSRAVELSGSASGIVYEFDEAAQEFHARATHRITAEYLEVLRSAPIRLGEGAMGRAGVIREPVEVADIENDRQLVAPQVQELVIRQGHRSLLALPLVREERLLGGLVILRSERGAFSPEVVATLRTFAAQSVLAIHNASLFREIQRQKQYSDALVQTSPVAIVTLNLDGKVTSWNPGAERLFQYPQEEAVGSTMEQLVATPEARDEIRSNIRQTLGGEWVRAIGRRARKDGTRVDVEISSMPVVVEGTQVGMIAIYHDITELLRARREAEAANEAKSAFLAMMSHEIRTPMNAVIGMSGLLLNTQLSEEQREYAEVVRQSGDALLTVINDILDFSKIEAGRLELESQPFDLRECVEGALDLVATRAAEKGLDLAYLMGESTPAGVMGDVTRLRQVLLNLLSNAVKFTERGEVVLSVNARPLDSATRLHELTFSVRDTGIGIPPDRVGRLFQSFSQVDASTTRRYGGTGLGLAISQRLTELMGGRIEVTSEVGVGSEFVFTIRAAAADVPVPARRDLSGLQPTLRGKRVLVVDDNDTNRRILTTHFAAWGLDSRATGSPLEALGWIRSGETFDIGILDMHMPEMDGVALSRAIREQAGPAAPPLVLFTSLGRREARAESEDFAAYLHKPIKPSQLFDALVSVLVGQTVHVVARDTPRSEIVPDMARRHPLRILLAEDNVVNQKVALRLLAQMGYRADVAANGLEAIDAVGRQVYDVILMDVQMPELDGFEASREINRRWPGDRRPRIVAMTANAMQGDRELCAAAGMDDYVAKPVRIEELVAALERSPRRGETGTRAATVGAPAEPATPAGPRVSSISRRLAASNDARRTAKPKAESPEPAAVDRTIIEQLTAAMGGPFVAELIRTFIEDGRTLVATLHRALSDADTDAFRRAAHSLKSTGETVGALGMAAIARELEASARAGSLAGTEGRVAQVDQAFTIATLTLEELRRGLSG
jgi:PAS domain S-box-containing protein